jgi:predicted DNA-binding protein
MYTLYIVKRTQIYLEDEQDARLTRRAQGSGVTKSQLIRQAIDSLLDVSSDRQSALTRFRSALKVTQETPIHLPDGERYVADLRARDAERQAELDRRR